MRRRAQAKRINAAVTAQLRTSDRLRRGAYGSADRGRSLCAGERPQLAIDRGNNRVPVAARRLAKESRRRVPRAVMPPEQPAPIGHERQEDPDRLSERAGKMRNG